MLADTTQTIAIVDEWDSVYMPDPNTIPLLADQFAEAIAEPGDSQSVKSNP